MPKQAKILIIDDDPDYRASTGTLLEAEGYEVLEADGGQQGLARAHTEHPDLIILDVMMGSLQEGYSINQAIKFAPEYRDIAHIPILMVSSMGMDPKEMYGWIGDTTCITPDAYLTKPFDIPVFLRQVRELLQLPPPPSPADTDLTR